MLTPSIWSKEEQNRMFAHYQTCYSLQIQLKVLYMQVSERASTLLQYSYMMSKTWMVLRHYAHYRSTTLQKLTFILKVSQSFKFWLFCLAFFCSTLTQTVLTRAQAAVEVTFS